MRIRLEEVLLRLLKIGLHFYIIGIVILTLGIALSIQSTLGTSPFDALLVGLHHSIGLSIGSWEIVVGFAMVLGNAFIEKKRPEYFALITSLITGIGIDSWMFIIRIVIIPMTWIGQWLCLIFALIFIVLGVAIYLQSEFAPNPMDRTMVIIMNRTGWNATYFKASVNFVLVIIAFLFHGPIGIGTLLNAVFVGMFIGMFLPIAANVRRKSYGRVELENETAQ